jgi:hypothetical protein
MLCDMADVEREPRELRTPYGKEGEEWWAKLGPARRAAFNRLRRHRCLPPYPEPKVDLAPKPKVPAPKPFDELSPFARALGRDGGGDLDLWRALLAETAVRLTAHESDPNAKRPAHRPKTLSREIAEHATTTLLRVWDRLPLVQPRAQRWSLRAVREKVLESYGISRSEVLKLLKKLRERSH